MSFFDFGPNDIIHTAIVTNPRASVSLSGNAVTGSVFLERPYLSPALARRQMQGFSERLGGLTTKLAGISSSIDVKLAVKNGTNAPLYAAIQNLYTFYSLYDTSRYSLSAQSSSISVINIPEVYYDRCIKTGSFTGSDYDSNGNQRFIYDDGRGGLYTDQDSGSMVGNIFYSEGLVVLTSASHSDFGMAVTGSGLKWSFNFAGQHTIPVNVYRCRAPAGQLNATTNPSFHYVPSSGAYRNTRQVLSSSLSPYITAVGLYNEDYELVAVARLAQPIKKEVGWDVGINVKLDW
jgi:hypothetical protein